MLLRAVPRFLEALKSDMAEQSAVDFWFYKEQVTGAEKSDGSQSPGSSSCRKQQQPLVIWLHGWGQNHHALSRMASLISGYHILFDLPGFGKTPPLHTEAGTADYADALLTQLERINAAKPNRHQSPPPHILVGHSFGARVAIRYAKAHPQKVTALVLIAGAGLKPKRSLKQKIRAAVLKLGARTTGFIDKLFGTRYKNRYADHFGSNDYKAAGVLRCTFVKTVTEDLEAIACSLPMPVLIITGSEDQETPPSMAQRYGKAIKGSSVHIIDGYGHIDILDRGVYQCESLIQDFIASLDFQQKAGN